MTDGIRGNRQRVRQRNLENLFFKSRTSRQVSIKISASIVDVITMEVVRCQERMP